MYLGTDIYQMNWVCSLHRVTQQDERAVDLTGECNARLNPVDLASSSPLAEVRSTARQDLPGLFLISIEIMVKSIYFKSMND